MHNYFTIIPARKNSLRLKNKNIQLFNKKPLIEHTFNLVKKIKKLDLVVLSTNDKKVVKIANKKKILVPFKRPEKLSKKNSELDDVIFHALSWYKEQNNSYPKNIVLLQPTSPLRNAQVIKKLILDYEKKNCDSMISVCDPFQNPADLYYFDSAKKIKKSIINKKHSNKKQKVFFIDGSVYVCKTKKFLKNKKIVDEKTKMFLIKKDYAFDIDNKFDFDIAEAYSLRKKNKR